MALNFEGGYRKILTSYSINLINLYYEFLPNTLVELATANKAVPISANTASHMDANPTAPSMMKIPLMTNAKHMFCQTIFRVCFAIETASAIFKGESVIRTTSLDSNKKALVY